MAKKKRRKKQTIKQQFTYEIIGLLLLTFAVLGLADLGKVGRWIIYTARFLVGEWYAILLVSLIILAFYFIWKRKVPNLLSKRLVGFYIIFLSILTITHIQFFQLHATIEDASVIKFTLKKVMQVDVTADVGGGMIGAISFAFFYQLFDEGGTMFLSVIFTLIAILLITGKSPIQYTIDAVLHMYELIKKAGKQTKAALKNRLESIRESRELNKPTHETQDDFQPNVDEHESIDEGPIIEDFQEHVKAETDSDVLLKTETVHGEKYELPPLELLNLPPKSNQNKDRNQIASNIKKLEQTFESFGVHVKVLKVHVGPAVTRYEVHPAVGVKVSKIVNLSDDLALALAAKDIRIEAPIPGKSAVGIEVPNQEISLVSLREVLESPKYKQNKTKLAIGLGRDISGEPIIADLARMPHLLIAGATGSGKSVCINAIVTSLLMKAKPNEVKLMLIDPKMVELSVYNGIPHLLIPVVTDPKKASQALKKVVEEMERRYQLFSNTGTRNIEGYNEYVRSQSKKKRGEKEPLPYIVVIVDELADLMMVAPRDVEEAITRLAQMARAAGIHLIIATQRPSVDVITGVIKANIPSRIAFSVSSQVDSRTILDMSGAEKLLGQGDMLFLPAGHSKPIRIQGAFLSDEEVERVVNFVVSQQQAVYDKEMLPEENHLKYDDVDDELFEAAVQFVIERQMASVSMLQRKFRIGYTRAARLIDEMEARNIVGPYDGSRPRAVLISNREEASSS